MNLLVMAVPIEVADAANRLGATIDPDTGGAQSFKVRASLDGNLPATHYICSTFMREEYQQLIMSKDKTLNFQNMTALALERGREPPTQADVDIFLDNVLFNDEVNVVPLNEPDELI